MPFGGMLGSTFNFIFENQLEKLQDGDRFYYLERTAGLAFNAELESNSFAKLIMANTDATHLPALVFSTPACILEVDQIEAVHGLRAPTAAPTRPARHSAHAAGDPRQPEYCRTGYELPAVHRRRPRRARRHRPAMTS